MRLQNALAIPGVTYLEALRWRGAALPRMSPQPRMSIGDRAGRAGPGADHRRKRCRHTPGAEA